jgi:hypothetical protein
VTNVNRLVEALLARPHVIDLAVQEEATPFDLLTEMLDDALFSRSEREVIVGDPGLHRRLRAGYLPTITAPDWDGALTLADRNGGGGSGWWTVMIAAPGGGVGLTVPQDSSEDKLVALFTGPADDAGTLVYDPATGSVFDLSRQAHCGPPSRGRCAPGTCGGCRARKVWNKATGFGIACRCPDQAG